MAPVEKFEFFKKINFSSLKKIENVLGFKVHSGHHLSTKTYLNCKIGYLKCQVWVHFANFQSQPIPYSKK